MELEKIKMYSIRAHEIATAHGFHDEKKSDAHWLCPLPRRSQRNSATQKRSLVISEVMEAVEADRKDYRADMIGFDIEWHIKHKMEFNAQRQRLHGKKY